MTSAHTVFRVGAALGLTALMGCEDDTLEFNELEDLRVLAVRAEPPMVRPGSDTTVDALVYLEGGDPAAVRYSWSYCPFLDPQDPRRCWADEAEFAAAFNLPEGALNFDLGHEPTARFTYLEEWRPLLQQLCNSGAAVADDLGGLLFNCDEGFPMNILVTVRHEASEDEEIASTEVRLVVEEGVPDEDLNQNPQLLDRVLFALKEDSDDEPPRPELDEAGAAAGESSAAGRGPGFPVRGLLVDGTPIRLGEAYRLYATIDTPPQAFLDLNSEDDMAVPERRAESLFITWFISSGETEYMRTSLIEDLEDPLPVDENDWELPLPGDEDKDEADLFLVLRDERGGIDWISRKVQLVR